MYYFDDVDHKGPAQFVKSLRLNYIPVANETRKIIYGNGQMDMHVKDFMNVKENS